MTKPEMIRHCVELLAGGWESDMLALLSDEEAASARKEAVLLRRRLLREAHDKKLRGRQRAPVADVPAQIQLV